MSESIFASIIEEWADRDWASYADAPPFETSKKHDRAMQRIFRRYERNTRKFRPRSEARIKHVGKKVTVALLVIILAALAGCAAVHIITQSFKSGEKGDRTILYLNDTKLNCPSEIEIRYYMSELPESFEIFSFGYGSWSEQTDADGNRRTVFYSTRDDYYSNYLGKTVVLEQTAKPHYSPEVFATQNCEMSEIEINGHSAAVIEKHDSGWIYIIWDNGDYVIKLWGNVDKNDLIKLAKSIKLSKNLTV